eukprot:TRINITY_DN104410_c0_g1_i1.p1 TRINITY_DN104410_c0_g1~~TRINITY_DN104410_c0_g1_i1.p1  ORF type:complete len:389 (+),score=112.65 TRINITY_DN104410_c0_g1_i1:92-1258(+)
MAVMHWAARLLATAVVLSGIGVQGLRLGDGDAVGLAAASEVGGSGLPGSVFHAELKEAQYAPKRDSAAHVVRRSAASDRQSQVASRVGSLSAHAGRRTRARDEWVNHPGLLQDDPPPPEPEAPPPPPPPEEPPPEPQPDPPPPPEAAPPPPETPPPEPPAPEAPPPPPDASAPPPEAAPEPQPPPPPEAPPQPPAVPAAPEKADRKPKIPTELRLLRLMSGKDAPGLLSKLPYSELSAVAEDAQRSLMTTRWVLDRMRSMLLANMTVVAAPPAPPQQTVVVKLLPEGKEAAAAASKSSPPEGKDGKDGKDAKHEKDGKGGKDGKDGKGGKDAKDGKDAKERDASLLQAHGAAATPAAAVLTPRHLDGFRHLLTPEVQAALLKGLLKAH